MRLVPCGIALTGFLAVVAAPALADLSGRPGFDCAAWNTGAIAVSLATPATSPPAADATPAQGRVLDVTASLLFATESGAEPSATAEHAEQSLREVPPLPDSASLFLSAALSVGAWQLVRSAKQIDLAYAPEWYHVEGPMQVGHATAFDLDMHVSVLCRFEQRETDHTFLRIIPEQMLRLDTQFAPAAAAPRGPPASC